MLLRAYEADDHASVEAGRQILNAARASDTPWLPELTTQRREMDVRYGWDQSPVRHLLAWEGGVAVGVAELELGEWDNTDHAWCYLYVHPEHRRRGHGSAMLEQLRALGREAGRAKFGVTGWDLAQTGPFARRHGLVVGAREAYRVQRPQELPAGLAERAVADTQEHAADYELQRLPGYTPADLLPDVAAITGAINDAPTEELDVEDEVFPVERITAYEQASIQSGHRFYRLLARHRSSGAYVGQTVVLVDAESPEQAHQHDTSVVAPHRGHRLGLLLKADMMRWLAEAEPAIETLDTENAESNDHMIAINEQLGYRVVGRLLDHQPRGLPRADQASSGAV